MSGDVAVARRGPFSSEEVNALHAAAFGTRLYSADEWDWAALCAEHSLAWLTARETGPDGGPGSLVDFDDDLEPFYLGPPVDGRHTDGVPPTVDQCRTHRPCRCWGARSTCGSRRSARTAPRSRPRSGWSGTATTCWSSAAPAPAR